MSETTSESGPAEATASESGPAEAYHTPKKQRREEESATQPLETSEPSTPPIVEFKNIRCAIHGFIALEPLLCRIMDTSYFQRLRELKQLGTVYHVYPTANHTRFDHSLGVAHLAQKLCERLSTQGEWPEGVEPPTPRDALCVKLAALCHDIGHGPFSHTFDGHVVPEAAKRLEAQEDADPDLIRQLKRHKHELLSVEMLKHLLKERGINLSAYQASDGEYLCHEEDLQFVAELILGKKLEGGLASRRGRGTPLGGGVHSKDYLYDIVSNEESGLDVDKLDYLCRDRKAAIGNDPDLVIATLTNAASVRMATFMVRGHRVRRPVIAYQDKVMFEAYKAFRLRFDLHTDVYAHRVCEGYSRLVTDTLVALDALGPVVTVNGKAYQLGETVTSPRAFVEMRDNVLERYKVRYLEGGDLKGPPSTSKGKARELLRRYENREPYKSIFDEGITLMPHDVRFRSSTTGNGDLANSNDEIVAALKRRLAPLDLPEGTLQLSVCKRCHGLGERNPLLQMRFFSKCDPIHADAREYTEHELRAKVALPLTFELRSIRVFYTARRTSSDEKAEYLRVKKAVSERLAATPIS